MEHFSRPVKIQPNPTQAHIYRQQKKISIIIPIRHIKMSSKSENEINERHKSIDWVSEWVFRLYFTLGCHFFVLFSLRDFFSTLYFNKSRQKKPNRQQTVQYLFKQQYHVWKNGDKMSETATVTTAAAAATQANSNQQKIPHNIHTAGEMEKK